MNKLGWKMFSGLVAVALLTAACSSDSTSGGGSDGYGTAVPSVAASSGGSGSSGSSGSGSTMTIDGIAANVHGSKDVSGASTVSVEAGTDNGVNYFSPTVLTGKPGQSVTVQLANESSTVPHNFSVDGQDVNVDLDPSATQTVTVTFPESGSVTFFCEYHKASGMLGELTVG